MPRRLDAVSVPVPRVRPANPEQGVQMTATVEQTIEVRVPIEEVPREG
jgi:hypothetical protein